MNQAEIAAQIDHTVLAPQSKHQTFVDACRYAAEHHCASVCICPFFVRECADLLRNSGVKVCTVIGFPHGTHTTDAKVFESRVAMEDGADELDMVVNISKVKDRDWAYVENDIAAVCKVVHGANRILKVIFEMCFLDEEEKIRLCEICTRLGVDFVKTSTGYGTHGATVSDVALMKAHVGPHVRIKAAGGIHNAEELLAFRKAGATRFGCSRTEAVLAGFDA